MVIKNINLETVCGITSTLPENDKPEVAFAGKSNVGKSSLINALMNRKSYARISATPGKTQTINFYNINDEMYLVDLPGYGYARVSEKEKEQWGRMIERYLHSSKQLKAVFLLIDIRHDPSANDRMMYQWIVEQGYHPIIIATKLDKIKRSQIQKHVKMLKQGLDLVPGTKVIPFSSVSKQGKEDIWELIEAECFNVEAQDGDAVIVTGFDTGTPPTVENILKCKESVSLPILIGSGLNSNNVHKLLAAADGAIIGSWFKEDNNWKNPVSFKRAKEFMDRVKALRRQ